MKKFIVNANIGGEMKSVFKSSLSRGTGVQPLLKDIISKQIFVKEIGEFVPAAYAFIEKIITFVGILRGI